jgi:hypothetical protein
MGARQREAAATLSAEGSPPLVYRLSEPDLRRRARVTAWVNGGAALVPALLVLVVVGRFGLTTSRMLWVGLGLVSALFLIRVAVARQALLRRLRALTFEFRDDGVRVLTLYARYDFSRDEIERALDIEGELGGVRLVCLRPAGRGVGAGPPGAIPVLDRPRQIDIPRGGDRFGEVREVIGSWRPLVRPPRRGRIVRIAVGVSAIGLIFFFPFVADGLSVRGRVLAAVFIVGIWFALRAALRRE